MVAQAVAILLVISSVVSAWAAGRWVQAQQEALRRLPRPPATATVAERPFESLDLTELRLDTEATGPVMLPTDPFSPARVPSPSPEAGNEGQPTGFPPAPPKPQWLYKGAMTLGGQRRAVIEDVKSGDTKFVQVGDALGELKVLDIIEDRVVLSNPNRPQEQRVLELVE